MIRVKFLELLKENQDLAGLDLNIERVVVYKRSKKFVISFYLKKALSLGLFNKLNNGVKDILRKDDIDSSVYVR